MNSKLGFFLTIFPLTLGCEQGPLRKVDLLATEIIIFYLSHQLLHRTTFITLILVPCS